MAELIILDGAPVARIKSGAAVVAVIPFTGDIASSAEVGQWAAEVAAAERNAPKLAEAAAAATAARDAAAAAMVAVLTKALSAATTTTTKRK